MTESASPAPHAAQRGRVPRRRQQPQQLRVVTMTKPCAHNDWDNVRTKNGFVHFRCRVCDGQWKMRFNFENLQRRKCAVFSEEGACPEGAACPLLHVHSQKQSLQQRVQIHGASVLVRVNQNDASPPPPPRADGDLETASTFSDLPDLCSELGSDVDEGLSWEGTGTSEASTLEAPGAAEPVRELHARTARLTWRGGHAEQAPKDAYGGAALRAEVKALRAANAQLRRRMAELGGGEDAGRLRMGGRGRARP